MGKIRGHYEWDDDALTPGQKKEGGLHQNLFDADGNLRGSARFIPDDTSDELEPLVITETVYVPIEERRRSRAEQELEEEIARLVAVSIHKGIEIARPIVSRWMRESVRPAIANRREQIRARRRARRERRNPKVIEATLGEDPKELAVPEPEADRPIMSKAEAQARYLAALAAKAFSAEQMRLVSSADVLDSEGIDELTQSIAELPADQVKALIEAMVTKPAMLEEGTLADLASLLARLTPPAEDMRRLP